MEPILEVRNLKKYFEVGRKQILKAVDDVSFSVYEERRWDWWENRDAGRQPVGEPVLGYTG